MQKLDDVRNDWKERERKREREREREGDMSRKTNKRMEMCKSHLLRHRVPCQC